MEIKGKIVAIEERQGKQNPFWMIKLESDNKVKTYSIWDKPECVVGDNVTMQYDVNGNYNNAKSIKVEVSTFLKDTTKTETKPTIDNTSTSDERLMFLEADVEALHKELKELTDELTRVKGLLSGDV